VHRRADPTRTASTADQDSALQASTTSPAPLTFCALSDKVERSSRTQAYDYIPKSFVAAYLAGIWNKYPDPAVTTARLSPRTNETKEVFAQRLLESEKNETINQEINSLTPGHQFQRASVNATTRNPGHSSADPPL